MSGEFDLLPPGIAAAIEARFGHIMSVHALSGGMVNTAARVDAASGPLFVKWKRDAPAALFAREAAGLQLLDGASPLRVPKVLHVAGEASPECPSFLVLEWIDVTTPANPDLFAQRLAEGVATLHASNPSPDAQYGLGYDNFLGALEQSNAWTSTWPAFYRDQRLSAMLRLGRRDGWLSPSRSRRLETVIEHTEDLLGHSDTRAEMIHGDLWAGNFVCSPGNNPVLIDPAVHYADREVEMAFIELFGGFPRRFGEIYRASYPLDPGYPSRRPLLQLYPLLVHLRHFGEEYGPPVDAILARYSA
ncbi:MAG: fructosamine kinase family protein [Capsulimonadaceae bacterium]|nr:fructosamine kinase family protein [Capsulimonadaceae bacterium]